MTRKRPKRGWRITVAVCCALGAIAAVPVEAGQPPSPSGPPLAGVEASSPASGLAVSGRLSLGPAPCRSRADAIRPTVASSRSMRVRGTLTTKGAVLDSCCGCGTDPNLIFDDGFESGNTSAWSATAP